MLQLGAKPVLASSTHPVLGLCPRSRNITPREGLAWAKVGGPLFALKRQDGHLSVPGSSVFSTGALDGGVRDWCSAWAMVGTKLSTPYSVPSGEEVLRPRPHRVKPVLAQGGPRYGDSALHGNSSIFRRRGAEAASPQRQARPCASQASRLWQCS